jgi:hypothetical protein
LQDGGAIRIFIAIIGFTFEIQTLLFGDRLLLKLKFLSSKSNFEITSTGRMYEFKNCSFLLAFGLYFLH